MNVEDVPCDHCGAAAKEPCRPDCASWQLDGMSEGTQAQRALMAVAYRLPFSGLIDTPPTYDGDLAAWLARFALWLESYRELLRGEVDHLQADSARAIALQLEKDVIRGFLGVSDGR